MRNNSILFILCFAWASVAAQKPAALKSQGEAAFANQRWEEALAKLSQYQELKPGDKGVLSKIGQASYQLHLPEQAKKYLTYITDQAKSREPLDWFFMARTYHGLADWELAIAAYKQFLRLTPETHPLHANVRDNILRCVNAIAVKPDPNVALVENLGEVVNSKGDDFAPLPSINHPGRLYYSSARATATGGLRNDDGYEDEKTGHWSADMYFADRLTAGWEQPISFSVLQNTPRSEVALDFTDDGTVLHFFRGFTLYGGEIFTDTAGLNDEYLSSPQSFAGPVRAEEGDQGLFYVNDSTVLFASRRAGGFGGLDLWASRRNEGLWSVPTNLGPEINSAYDETTPFLCNDGVTIYYSSNRIEGIGGLDVWKSVFIAESRTWEPPVMLGTGINSPGDDMGFRLLPDGNSGYFASNRIVDNLGERDIYQVYFKEIISAQTVSQPFAFFAPVLPIEGGENARPVLVLAPLYYTVDRDLTGPENIGALKSAAALARQFPEIQLLITLHTDETGPAKFDLYSGIRRAELMGKTLVNEGIEASRITLRSAGSGYPIARNILNGADNLAGQALNRRGEVVPRTFTGVLPIDFRLDRPVVSELMGAAGTANLDQQNEGLLYRVEMTTAQQVVTSDALGLFSDLLIESQPGTGQYRYMTGAFRSFAQAGSLRREVSAAGFPTANIVAYLNGLRLSKAEAVGLVKKYPDLAAYIRG